MVNMHFTWPGSALSMGCCLNWKCKSRIQMIFFCVEGGLGFIYWATRMDVVIKSWLDNINKLSRIYKQEDKPININQIFPLFWNTMFFSLRNYCRWKGRVLTVYIFRDPNYTQKLPVVRNKTLTRVIIEKYFARVGQNFWKSYKDTPWCFAEVNISLRKAISC